LKLKCDILVSSVCFQSRVNLRRYAEGWVEFRDKKVARNTAQMLNGRVGCDCLLIVYPVLF
jgi:hypothetical protein